jgi:hypothetical protein
MDPIPTNIGLLSLIEEYRNTNGIKNGFCVTCRQALPRTRIFFCDKACSNKFTDEEAGGFLVELITK